MNSGSSKPRESGTTGRTDITSKRGIERVDSLDLTHLRRIPEEGKILSELSSSSQHLNDVSNRSSGNLTNLTASTRSMQSMGSSLQSSSLLGNSLPSMGDALAGESELGQTMTSSHASYPEYDDSSSTRCISFGVVEIKEYPCALGDNPSCTSGGPPLSLGWRPLSAQKLDLEDYETHRVFSRRKKEQMRVPPNMREVSMSYITHLLLAVCSVHVSSCSLLLLSFMLLYAHI